MRERVGLAAAVQEDELGREEIGEVDAAGIGQRQRPVPRGMPDPDAGRIDDGGAAPKAAPRPRRPLDIAHACCETRRTVWSACARATRAGAAHRASGRGLPVHAPQGVVEHDDARCCAVATLTISAVSGWPGTRVCASSQEITDRRAMRHHREAFHVQGQPVRDGARHWRSAPMCALVTTLVAGTHAGGSNAVDQKSSLPRSVKPRLAGKSFRADEARARLPGVKP